MIDKPSDDPFLQKMRKVRDVLVRGEGFIDAQVLYEQDARIVRFHAEGAASFQMRRDDFDRKSDCEIAFFVATKMRPPPIAGKPAPKRVT